MYIGDYTGRRALYTPDDLAVVDAGRVPHRTFTYRDLNERADRLANWLRDGAGVRPGDRVAVLAYNGVEYLDVFFACSKLGAQLVGLNWRLRPTELSVLVDRVTPRVLVFSDDFRETAAHLAESCADIGYLLHIEGRGLPNSRPFERTLSESVPRPVTNDTITEEDIACLIFTGGTTGYPRAARISHRMIAWNTLNTVIHDLQHGDITVNTFALFHAGGLLVYTLPLMILGGTVVLSRHSEPGETLRLVEEYGATVHAASPTSYLAMLNAPEWPDADLSTLRFGTSGGAPLPVPLARRFIDEKGVPLKQGFGMTEFGPGAFALAPEDAERKAGSIGRVNFFVDARVANEQGQPQPPGMIGELMLRGPSLCSGYFGDPDPIDADGWFRTGDLATVDEQGYFTIVDRKKDMIISDGENVFPAEVEGMLYRHPDVDLCAVVGVPDAQHGEVGMAFVVPTPDGTASEGDLLAYLQHHLAGYKVPKSVVFVDSLPISGAGKVLKGELVKRAVK